MFEKLTKAMEEHLTQTIHAIDEHIDTGMEVHKAFDEEVLYPAIKGYMNFWKTIFPKKHHE